MLEQLITWLRVRRSLWLTRLPALPALLEADILLAQRLLNGEAPLEALCSA